MNAPLFFIASFVVGLWLTARAWNGQVYVYIGEHRAPAAVRSLVDYSSLDRRALYRSAHTQLMANAEVVRQPGSVGIQFGHPVLNKSGGGKQFGCEVADHSGVFDRIEVVFIGTGVFEGGEPARMTVDAQCQSSRDLNRLETLWIPMGDITASAARDQELQIFGENPVRVRLEDIPSHWPESWVLWSVRLYREDNPDESLKLDTPLLKQARPTLLSFDWKPEAAASEKPLPSK